MVYIKQRRGRKHGWCTPMDRVTRIIVVSIISHAAYLLLLCRVYLLRLLSCGHRVWNSIGFSLRRYAYRHAESCYRPTNAFRGIVTGHCVYVGYILCFVTFLADVLQVFYRVCHSAAERIFKIDQYLVNVWWCVLFTHGVWMLCLKN